MDKEFRNFLISAGAILAIVVWALAPKVVADVSISVFELFKKGQQGGNIEKTQKALAEEIRNQAPIKLDNITTLGTAANKGKNLTFHLQLSLSKNDARNINWSKLKTTIIQKACSNMEDGLNSGGEYAWEYYSSYGDFIERIEMNKSDCHSSVPTRQGPAGSGRRRASVKDADESAR